MSDLYNIDAKTTAAVLYMQERESCKNPDGSKYECSHAEVMAFMNGWDAAIKFYNLKKE